MKMGKGITVLVFVIVVIGNCFAWDAPVQLLPDSIHVYEIPRDVFTGDGGIYCLGRIGDSSSVIRLKNHDLTNVEIIAISDTMWEINTSESANYELATWHQEDGNRVSLRYVDHYTDTIMGIYPLPFGFSSFYPYCGESDEFEIIAFTEHNALVKYGLDTLGIERFSDTLFNRLRPMLSDLYPGFEVTAYQYDTSWSSEAFCVVNTRDTTLSEIYGKEPVIYWESILYLKSEFITSPPWFRWDIYKDGLGYITDSPAEESFISHLSKSFFVRYGGHNLIFLSEGSILGIDEDRFGDTSHIDTILAGVNPVTLGVVNIWYYRSGYNNSSWILWTDTLGVLWGINEILSAGDISEAPTDHPSHFSLSAHPNPFNSEVRISFSSVETGHDPSLQIEIFDVNGRMVAQLPEGGTVGEALVASRDAANRNFSEAEKREGTSPSPTTCEFTWTPDETLPSGVYLVRATIEGNKGLKPLVQTKRIVYMK